MRLVSFITSVPMLLVFTSIAQAKHRNTQVTQVPEIDASAGLLALATVLAALVFVWERRRRRAKTQ